jgi:hypothetical protein
MVLVQYYKIVTEKGEKVLHRYFDFFSSESQDFFYVKAVWEIN